MLGNIVRETSTAPGTGTTVTLNGATAGRRTFLDEFGAGASCFYFITDGTQTEAQIGTVAAGPPATLTRGTPVWTSAAGATSPTRLNFTGTVTVYSALPGQRAVYTDGSGDLKGITAAKLRTATGATTVGDALLTAADKAAGRTAIDAAVIGAIGSSGLTMATDRLLGRTTASAGAVEEISVGTGLTLSGGTLSAAGGTVTSIAAGAGLTGGTITDSGTVALDVYSGSTANNTSFPVGTVVMVATGSSPPQNGASATIYVPNNGTAKTYQLSSSSAVALTGTWRARGSLVTDIDEFGSPVSSIALFQRVA